MTQATWKARCILLAAGIENSLQTTLRNHLSAANIHMQWEIPAVLCTNTQSLQTASLDIRADLSGIILTSQSTKRTDTASGSLTYGGDFGDRPTDGDFSGNGICYGGEREASPKMQEVKFNYQNISVDFDSDYIFTVTNKNLFVNTSVLMLLPFFLQTVRRFTGQSFRYLFHRWIGQAMRFR